MSDDPIFQAVGGIVMALVFGGLFFLFVKLFHRLSGLLRLGDDERSPAPDDSDERPRRP